MKKKNDTKTKGQNSHTYRENEKYKIAQTEEEILLKMWK